MGHRREWIGAVVVCALSCAGWVCMASSVQAQEKERTDLESYMGALIYYLDQDASVKYRGYDRKRGVHLEYVKAQKYIPGQKFPSICDLKLKKKHVKNMKGWSRFWEYFVIPVNLVDTAEYKQVSYRQDMAHGRVGYYGHSVIVRTKWWDMTVINRVKEPYTREKEIEIVFSKEQTARDFMSVLTRAAAECRLQRSGVGSSWNKR